MIVYENPWFKVIRQDGYHFVDETNSQSGAAVLIVQGDRFLLLEMNRLAQGGERTLEIPRGYADDGENSRQCACREVLEETGYRIDERDLQLLGHIRPNSGLLKTRVALYFAVIPEHAQSEKRDNEARSIVPVPTKAISAMLAAGELEDSFTLAALCYLRFKDQAEYRGPNFA